LQASADINHCTRTRDGIPHQFLRLLLFIDALSLVAPIVAVVWQFALSRDLQSHLSPWEPLALGLAIWSLYAADHVFDALRGNCSLRDPVRKAFHRVHWQLMAALAICSAAGSVAITVSSLSNTVLVTGLAIGAFVLVYFVSVHAIPFRWRGFWPREAAVALGFGLGTFMPIVPAGRLPSAALIAASIVFVLLCWLNCCAVETWEWQRSGRPFDGTPHRSTRWIADHLSGLAIAVGTGALVIGLWLDRGSDLGFAGFSSGAALCLLSRSQDLLSDSMIGVSADLALCVPLFFCALR
jgi:hypothetical protein